MNRHVIPLLISELEIKRSSSKKFHAYDLLSEYADGLLKTELEALAALYFSLVQHPNLLNGNFLVIQSKIESMEIELKNKYLHYAS